MRRFISLIFMMTFTFETARLWTVSKEDVVFKEARDNYCSRLVSYKEEHVVPETKRKIEVVKTWCWSLILKCTKHKVTIEKYNKTIIVTKTKLEFDCCPGYEKKGEACIPICKLGCGHGKCVEPDICLCEPGWREPYCLNECEPNKYGSGCMDNCTCLHGAECDKETGSCNCTAGFFGESCEMSCPKNTFGDNCKSRCECKNDAICDIFDGTCYCKPGYKGELCGETCANGTHGQDCEKTCICIPENTDSCHHVDGQCICKPGYQGESCEKECYDFSYGRNCSEKCNCLNSDYCDNVDGECNCEPGWTGPTCSEICPVGKFGENCSLVCDECSRISGICDNVNGYCNCPPGYYGDLCEKTCLLGRWGSNCTNECNCTGRESCNPRTGGCFLSEGFYGYRSLNYVLEGILTLAVVIAVISFIFWSYFKNRYSFLHCRSCISSCISPFRLFRFRRHNDTEFTQGGVYMNQAYENPIAIIESDKTEGDYIRGSYSGGVRYFTNNLNKTDTEDKPSNSENVDVAEETKINRKSELRRSTALSDFAMAVKEITRLSSIKKDSVLSSKTELEEDFTPETLTDFNVIENIYETPRIEKLEKTLAKVS